MKSTIKTIMLAGFTTALLLFVYHQYFQPEQKIIHVYDHQQESMPVRQASYVPVSNALSVDFNKAAQTTVNAVVHIKTEFTRKSATYDDFFSINDMLYGSRQRVYKASGSGVIISSDGYIVTNNHVVGEADKITVVLNDKRSYKGRIIGLDPTTDLALIKIEEKELPYLHFANSDKVKIGEWVLAVGNPFNLTSTVTAGIVSAKARNINILGSNTAIESFIQTDAAVNPGNSGGALVNTDGLLVGINAAIASGTGYYTGYSFAIPSNIVKKVVKDLRDYGQVQRAILGVSIQEMDADKAKELGLKEVKGVYVEGVVEGLSAAKAGLKKGDIILSIDEFEVNSRSALMEKVGMHRPGDKMVLSYIHNKQRREKTITLTDMNGETGLKKRQDLESKELGAVFEAVSKRELEKLGLDNGVKVKKLSSGLLRSAGIKESFVITKIDQSPVIKPADVERILQNKKGGILIEGTYPSGVKAYYGIGL